RCCLLVRGAHFNEAETTSVNGLVKVFLRLVQPHLSGGEVVGRCLVLLHCGKRFIVRPLRFLETRFRDAERKNLLVGGFSKAASLHSSSTKSSSILLQCLTFARNNNTARRKTLLQPCN